MSRPGWGRNPSPCLDCQDRKTECSDHCSRYKSWIAEVHRITGNRRAYMDQRSEDTVLKMAAQAIGTTVDCLREMQFHNRLLGKTVYGIRCRIVRHIGRKSKKYDSFVVDKKILHQWAKDCYVAEKVCTRSDLTRLGETVFLTQEEAEAAIGARHE